MQNKKKILFLVAHRPGRSPGQRFRFEQYLDYLNSHGFDCTVSYLIDEKDDDVFYASGRYFHKTGFVIKSLLKRFRDIRSSRNYDLVFLYREAHFLGTTWFEKFLKRKGVKMIVDFDDSIWLKDVSNGNRKLAFLKRPGKTSEIVALCDAVVVGNNYLASYSSKHNPNVHIIPTTIDTTYYLPATTKKDNDVVCIGWTGSSTTIKHFTLAVPVLKNIRKKYGNKVVFRLISDELFQGELEGLEMVKWNKATEVQDLNRIDIGIMPLPDDDWAKGKCGFKGLQYMALEKAAVLSPVGVNTEIISHGHNGFLASTHEEWEQILSALIENPQLRMHVGINGRKTVIDRYSYDSQKDSYLKIFQSLTEEKHK